MICKLSELCSKYPKMVPEKSLMAPFAYWGFECNDGWYELIDELCADLQTLTDQGHPQLKMMQVKEKFGALRFNAPGGSDAQKSLIRAAQQKSLTICELCGNPGSLDMSGSWHKVRCNNCK